MASSLSGEQAQALGALAWHGERNMGGGWGVTKFEGADWIGVCRMGHPCIAVRPMAECTHDIAHLGMSRTVCLEPYIELPEEAMSAWRLGGWPALVEIAQALLASK